MTYSIFTRKYLIMSKPLEKNEIVERMQKHLESGKFIYAQDQIAVPLYFDTCYEYLMANCIDATERKIKGIEKVERKQKYKIRRKPKVSTDRTNRGEEWFVLDMFYQNTDKNNVFGELQGYQVPIKGKRDDKGVGKIDFISVIDGFLYLHELKADYSRESILKAILEVQTYYQQINHERLIDDFGLTGKVNGIKKSVVIFKGSEAYEQLDEPEVQNLLKLFEIELFILERSVCFSRFV